MDQLTFTKKTDQSIGPSAENLANALGISPEELDEALQIPSAQRYIPFTVSGGTRVVYRTHSRIKFIQQKIKNRILADCINYPKYVFGSIKDPDFKRDYVNCAAQHCGARSLLKVDIEKFFDNISIGNVRRIFRDLLHYPDPVCSMLCDLTTHNGYLPQGAPTSSHLATLCFFKEEPDIVEQAQAQGLVYTRLMDDITVSSKSYDYDFHRLERLIRNMIETKDLTVNEGKSETFPTVSSTTLVHGLKINTETLRVSDKTLSNIRAAINQLEKDAKQPNKRTLSNYRKRYERTSGSLSVLHRLGHPKYEKYRRKLRRLRPLPSPYFLNKTWELMESIENIQDMRESAIYRKRFYMLHHKLNLAQRTFKAEAKTMRERLKEIKPK
ncbi:MAG: hypothetical protein CMK76_07220 [Pseudomonadales bacterium]|nr:hypothetical protein [Pseudomonadales bacterium]|tara:strand:+ start:345 stop:1493 length:1149 start_codon:yes stop_codon:yes gene_type:complete